MGDGESDQYWLGLFHTKAKMSFFKHHCLSCLIGSFLLLFPLASKSQTEVVLKSKVQEYQQIKSRTLSIKAKERELLSRIYKINRQQRSLAKSEAKLQRKKSSLKSKLNQLKREIKQLQVKIKVLKVSLASRLKETQKHGPGTFFQSLFHSKSLQDIEYDSRIFQKISLLDIEQIKKYEKMKSDLSKKRRKLAVTVKKIEENKTNIEEKRNKIDESYKSRMRLLSDLTSREKKLLQRIKKVRTSAKNIARRKHLSDLDLIFDESIYEEKGQLPMPYKGVVSSPFGLKEYSGGPVKMFNKGWFISGLSSSPVHAIYKGKVDFVGFIPDLNETVIVNHGDHYYSVYSNLKNVQVKLGEEVDRSLLLAEPNVSRRYGRGIYFELRHFSEPQDPRDWFSLGGRTKISSM